MSLAIFIASMTTSTSPFLTACPTSTFTEIYRDESEYLDNKRKNETRTRTQYYGSGTSFGYVKSPKDKDKNKNSGKAGN